MDNEYYDILQLPRAATYRHIQKAYRKLALQFHPSKAPEDPHFLEEFSNIAEAYDVLSNQQTRTIYDQFGLIGLKKGVPEGSGNAGAFTEGYTFSGDSFGIFSNFFGTDNPFQEFYDRIDGDMHYNYGGLYGYGQMIKNKPVVIDLLLTLEEMYRGCTKQIEYPRMVMDNSMKQTVGINEVITLRIKPGILEGAKITFPEAGDQGPNNVSADHIYVVKSKPHPRFWRESSDLHHTCDILLGASLTGHIIDLETLDERILHIPVTQVVSPNYTKVVKNEGFPIPDSDNQKGNLVIHFNVLYKSLTTAQRTAIKKAKV